MFPYVHSKENRYIKLYSSLARRKAREELSLLPLEGPKMVSDALAAGAKPEVILLRSQEDFPGNLVAAEETKIIEVEKGLFDKTAFTESPQGVLAVVRRPLYKPEDLFRDENLLLLIADNVQDPGNLGTMLRTAAAVGAGGVVLLPGTVDITNPKVLRAGSGAHFRIPFISCSLANLWPWLKEREIQVAAASANADRQYHEADWLRPSAVVIGNEGSGVSEEVLALASFQVSIPMAGEVDSLNAAVAMSVIFFEAARQRGFSWL